MLFDGLIDRRGFLTRAGGIAVAAGGCQSRLAANELRAARIIPGRVPEYVPGNLDMKWADEAMIRRAAELHPFDLQGRMILAVNARTTCVDPNLGYIGYSLIYLETQPPYMRHQIGDFADDTGRHTDSLWLNRSATNDHSNDEVVRKLAQNAMDMVDQGIAWNPPERPFSWTSDPKERLNYRFAHLPEGTRVILGLMSYYRATGDARALDTVRTMVRKHYEIAQKNDRYLWYPDYNYLLVDGAILPMRVVRGKWGIYPKGQIEGHIDVHDPKASGTGDMGGNSPAAAMGMVLMPVLRYYEDTKDPMAAELAAKLSRLIVDLMPQFAENIAQTHSCLATISGVLHTGHALGIPEFMEWAEDAYKKFIASNSALDFGWTPEYTDQPKGRLICEPCTTVDFLELALQLAQYRDPKYWDHAERIAMNQLLEGQMLRADFLERIPAGRRKPLPHLDSRFYSTDHVMNRILGCFGRPAPNDWICFNGESIIIGQCCFGSGPRGLYDAWYYAAQEDGDAVQVNLQFSKRLPSAVITSYMPGKAALDIEMTQAKKLRVRKPGWANVEQTRILIGGKRQLAHLDGSYFDLGHLQPGTRVRVEFPEQTVRKTERIGENEFRTTWRGNAVVDMEPAGEIYPLYQGRNRQEGVAPLPFVSPRPVNPL